jgi:hypothetical protein
MATYQDFDGVWFTVSGLRANHPDVEIIVVDGSPTGCTRTQAICQAAGGRYFHKPNLTGTSAPRDEVFRLAETPWVMVCDSHVIFESGAIEALIRHTKEHPESNDLIQGPLVYDNDGLTTHWRPTTPPGLWGVWDYDLREKEGRLFEIPMQGLGVFAMRREAWPGFNPLFNGFGGEEGYIHELVRRRGGKALCLPQLRWRHRFRDPRFERVPYPLRLTDHTWNLLVGHRELGIDALEAIRKDFGSRLEPGEFDQLVRVVEQSQKWNTPGERPAPLKMLGVWYSNNAAPVPLLQKSLGTIERAATLSRQDVRVITCPWKAIERNPFPQTLASYKAGPGHLNIVRQMRQAMGPGMVNGYVYADEVAWEPDVVCFLEHDVLYPPDYFDRVALAFRQNPQAKVVCNLDYQGLNATGWLAVKELHEPMHQISMRHETALANLERAEAECLAQGQTFLEPPGDRSDWARLAVRGVMPAIHVNHERRFTNHGEVVFHPDSRGRHTHPFWGDFRNWWPGAVPDAKQQSGGCQSCGSNGITSADLPPDLATWYEHTKARPSDFHEHMDTLWELAAKCEHVTEVSGWNKPALLALAAGCTGKVVSYCHGPKPVWMILEKLAGDRFRCVTADQPADIEPTDLLMVDTLHRATRVHQELSRYAPRVRKYLVVHCTSDPYGENGDDASQPAGGPGVMPGVRRFLSENKEWTVFRADTNNHGLMVLSRLDEDRKPLPGWGTKLANFAVASARHLANGRKPTSEKTFELRMAECLVCPERAHDHCSACGCPLESKLSWASETCGLVKKNLPPKWGPEE